MEAKVYTQQSAVINGYHVNHYLVYCESLGFQIHVIEWEDRTHELHNKIIDLSNDKAERFYNKICKTILAGVN